MSHVLTCSRYGGNLMLKLEYSSFQYMVVYIAVLQVRMLVCAPDLSWLTQLSSGRPRSRAVVESWA